MCSVCIWRPKDNFWLSFLRRYLTLRDFFFSETRCLIGLELVKYTSLAAQGLAYLFITRNNGIISTHYNVQLFKMCVLRVKLRSSGVQNKPLTKLSLYP